MLDDGCNSFDEDLGWILDKLNERAGGSFGLIVRFVEGVGTPALMACTESAAALPAGAMERFIAELRRCLPAAPDAETHELAVSAPVRLQDSSSPMRLLHMNFRPTPGVDIVVAVGRPESSSALLHGIVARRLYPVLSRYFRLWWLHRTERRRASAFETALDRAELGIALVDRSGQLVYENAYVRTILDDADGMRRAGKGMVPTNAADSLRLQVSLAHAIACNGDSSLDAIWQAPLILLRRGEQKRALILTVLPHRGRAVDRGDAAAIVYVLHPERDVRKCLAPVYRIYGLTPAEARLVTELVNGANLLEAANGMSISIATVRAQLKQVFDKTRTNRQAELVRVMLSSAVRSSVNVDLSLV
jgi:DNA-binding CsgD family transcriptional regulator